MKDRQGNWKDLFFTHSLAVDAQKIWLGYLATLATVAVFFIVSTLYGALGDHISGAGLIAMLLAGQCTGAVMQMLPLFNPFAGGWLHFLLSSLLYLSLMGVWTYFGSTITRIAALQYAHDDIPTLNDALRMVRKKRKAYFFAPATPLLGILVFALCNQLAGLVGSIPVIGPWFLTVLLPLAVFPATIVLTFIVVLGVLSFALMLPSISIGGKDAFEGWSSAYSYLLWGFNHFVVYSLISIVIGLLSILAAAGLSELFIALMNRTVSIGLIGGPLIETTVGEGVFRQSLWPVAEGAVGLQAASWVAVALAMLVRALAPAYAFSFFFTAGTIMCFLMRKHVDKIDIEDLYDDDSDADGEDGEEDLPEVDAKRTEEPADAGPGATADEPGQDGAAADDPGLQAPPTGVEAEDDGDGAVADEENRANAPDGADTEGPDDGATETPGTEPRDRE